MCIRNSNRLGETHKGRGRIRWACGRDVSHCGGEGLEADFCWYCHDVFIVNQRGACRCRLATLPGSNQPTGLRGRVKDRNSGAQGLRGTGAWRRRMPSKWELQGGSRLRSASPAVNLLHPQRISDADIEEGVVCPAPYRRNYWHSSNRIASGFFAV